jgi:hypothetical protein
MEWKTWSALPLRQRGQLPPHSGIYVVVDAQDQVWYVGRSVNLHTRWNGRGHHRYQQLSRTNTKRSYQIHWKNFPVYELDRKEQFYIDLFKPHLNYSRVRTYAQRAIQPHEEISRLLKVINQNTMLFPDVRSVVLGYYTEFEEENELLTEYTCLVIAVNVNDHDRPILNSYQKSCSHKGKSLKDYWQTYESFCGSDDPESKPALIPVFVLKPEVYEFVCYPALIEKLRQHQSALETVKIANQAVLALRDPSLLPSLIVRDRQFMSRSENYLHYRMPDLRPIQQLYSVVASFFMIFLTMVNV